MCVLPTYRPVPFDFDQERLELRRLRYSRRRRTGVSVLRPIARLGDAHEAPVDRQADGVHLFAVDRQRLDALRHHRLRHDRAALRLDTRTQSPRSMPFSLASSSPISTNCSGCSDRVEARVLGPEVEVLGQAIAGRHDTGIRRRRRTLPVVREDARRRIAAASCGCSGLRRAAFQTARSARGTGLRPSRRARRGGRRLRGS